MTFHEFVIAVDGYAEARGMPVPKTHKAERVLVKRHFSHLAGPCNDLYGPGVEGRYCKGYDMTKKAWCKAA